MRRVADPRATAGMPGLHRMEEGVSSLFHPSYVGHLTNMVNGRARVPLAAWLTSRVCGSLKGAVPGARDGCSLGSGVEHCLATSPSAC